MELAFIEKVVWDNCAWVLLLACVRFPTEEFGVESQGFINVIFCCRRTFSSSVYVPGVYEVAAKFNVSLTVALLGISMYVVGLGLGYVRVLDLKSTKLSSLIRDTMQANVQCTVIRG